MGTINTTQVWLDKTYKETLSLLEEAKHYHAYKFRKQTKHLIPVKKLEMTKESLRVTSRLSHTMAWLLSEKAIINEEIARYEFEAQFRPLSEEDICLRPPDTFDDCPNGLMSLMDRSFELFLRASRLEAMLRTNSPTCMIQRLH